METNQNDEEPMDGSANWEDEDECRVCRGPAEEGHPLYKPCKCSGSIGLTHQDCLQSWLEVQRGDGKCELCKSKFHFAPKYAEGAPEQLPASEVFYGLLRRCFMRWVPFSLRLSFAAVLWLVVAPLCTAYLYQAWMHKPSFVMERMQTSLFMTDLVSGVVVIACVILSFLSLISFADFLREEWQQNGLVQGGDRRREQQQNRAGEDEPRRFPAREQDVDNGLWNNVQQEILAQPAPLRAGLVGMDENDDAMHLGQRHEERDSGEQSDEDDSALDHDVDDDVNANEGVDNDDQGSDSSYDEDDEFLDDEHDDEEEEEWMLEPMEQDEIAENNAAQQRNARPPVFPPNNDGAPFENDPDDPVDVGINIALDEILGVRGPLSTVVQNLMWLLAFNTVYLGFFTFAPRVVGTSILSAMFNMSSPVEYNENATLAFNETDVMSISGVLKIIEYESSRLNTAFRIRDVASIIAGYLFSALVMILMRGLWVWSKKLRYLYTGGRGGHAEADDMRIAFEEMNRLAQALGHDNPQMDEPQVFALGIAVGVALDAIMAIIKVGLLLFMKMFLLPIVLGISLDLSTIDLIGGTIEDRITYAGKDLFSCLLLHWVAGITFMLLVTVSVLQLREVMHPDLLAQVIRPQEPQPDLLGNLLHETAGTHARRMLLSLIIYSVLLYLQIHFPVYLMLSNGLGGILSFFKLKFCYILMPQLQVPLELMVFHLCMLALLERNKNSIGEIQHHWLKFLCNQLGITDALLPRRVENFRLIGSRPVFVENRVIDNFWYSLCGDMKEPEGELLISEELETFRPPMTTCFNPGETKQNGERLLRFGSGFIRLPKRLPGRANRSRSVLLPTKFGRYRLKRDLFNSMDPVIQLWEEISGDPVPRPPEGWDDLGAGGADVQGRWAWGKEKKSVVERGVARRSKLFIARQGVFDFLFVILKFVWVLLASWVATTCFLAAVLGGPLAIGRFLYTALRVPEDWIHDPLGFAIGSMIFFPLAKTCTKSLFSLQRSISGIFIAWMRRFRCPPLAKLSVLATSFTVWFALAPLLFGFTYELAFVKDSEWFLEGKPYVENWLASWALGCFLLNAWGYCCASRFWVNILDDRAVVQDADIVAEADDRAAAWVNVGENRVRLRWQGKHGRVALFYETLWQAVCDSEWDKIDSTVLLDHCALPVLQELAWIMLVPQACLLLCLWRFPELSGTARLVLVRVILGLACTYEVLSAFQEELSSWFAAAHKTARDDRYLIGRVLLNYNQISAQT